MFPVQVKALISCKNGVLRNEFAHLIIENEEENKQKKSNHVPVQYNSYENTRK